MHRAAVRYAVNSASATTSRSDASPAFPRERPRDLVARIPALARPSPELAPAPDWLGRRGATSRRDGSAAGNRPPNAQPPTPIRCRAAPLCTRRDHALGPSRGPAAHAPGGHGDRHALKEPPRSERSPNCSRTTAASQSPRKAQKGSFRASSSTREILSHDSSTASALERKFRPGTRPRR